MEKNGGNMTMKNKKANAQHRFGNMAAEVLL
jgi:hypothetical protein